MLFFSFLGKLTNTLYKPTSMLKFTNLFSTFLFWEYQMIMFKCACIAKEDQNNTKFTPASYYSEILLKIILLSSYCFCASPITNGW